MPPQRWRAVADALRGRIERGELAPGDELPPQRALMQEFGTTSQNTISRAVESLVAEGMLVSQPSAPRRGLRVRSWHRVERDLIGGLRFEHERALSGEEGGDVGLFEAMTGTDGLTVSIDYSWTRASTTVAGALEIDEGSPLLERFFRYLINGTPHQIVTSHMEEWVAQAAGLTDVSAERVGRGTMAQLRDAGHYVDRVKLRLEARVPTETETGALAILSRVPVFAHRRTMYSAEAPLETSTAIVAGDSVAYVLDVDVLALSVNEVEE